MRVSFLLIAALGLVWCLIVGEFSLREWLTGSLFAAVLVFSTGWGRNSTVRLTELPRRLALLLWLCGLLLPYHIVRANLQVARRLLHNPPAINPGIVRVPVSELSQTALGIEEQIITLTPGQLVVDYSDTGYSDAGYSDTGYSGATDLAGGDLAGEESDTQARRTDAGTDPRAPNPREKVVYIHVLDVAAFEEQEPGSAMWMHDLLKRILA